MTMATLARAARYAGLFQSPLDAWRYARLRRASRRGTPLPPAELRLRALGGAALLCRPNQDVWTLKHTFVHGFHLPPAPLADDAVILDLGSNVGYTVADLAVRYPRARIVGVEMDDQNWRIARRNAAAFGDRVTVLHAAVWVEDGTVAYGGDEADAFHVLADGRGTGVRHAPAKRIGTLLDELGIGRVDYVKMDIEGAEAALLDGDLAWADRVRLMKIELHPPAGYAAAALGAHGFACRRDDRHWDTIVAVRPDGAAR
jgi:FkbM family methyltransferase